MLTVNGGQGVVERQLAGGMLSCPSCGGVLGGWGNACQRRVRVLDGPAVVLVPRRSRCRGCGATHVLLPAQLLSRRADTGEVIGAALEAKAAGRGHRAIALGLGRPASTVRGWLRALARNAGRVRERFTALAAGLVDGFRRCRVRRGRRPRTRWRRSRQRRWRRGWCRAWAAWRGGSWQRR